MDLTKACLPDAIEVSGKFYKIQTGHSYWFRFAQLIKERCYLTDFDHLYLGDVPEDRQAGVESLVGFYQEAKEIPRTEGDDGERVIDYDIDSDMIYAAILQCYGVDLMKEQMHWHKVRAMLAGIIDTRMNEIIGYRASRDTKNKELQRMKRIWALPPEQKEEDKERLDAFAAQFHNAQF